MNSEVQQTLLQLFAQVSENPSTLPQVPLEGWPEHSPERQLLAAFQQMIAAQHQRQYHLQQELTLTMANQAAVATENARLYERAQELAVLEERQRLARELHDSVSQALYGISLGAHTACTLLERDPSRLAEPLHYMLSLAETALMEMRALIFELRPEPLESEGLVGALTRQALVLRARQHLTVHTEFCAEPDAAFEIKETLYRIAQEALHNIVKHAQARTVTLSLTYTEQDLLLTIRDDGIGFDPTASFPGHLGLHSMHERASSLGGLLTIESVPGQGTSIWMRIPMARSE